MQVTIIGSGNVATVLARQLLHKGHVIVQVYSQTLAHATVLAQQVHAAAVDDVAAINKDADIYIIAVADRGIAAIAAALQLQDKLVLHTAGSVTKNVLQHTSNRYGVLYPIQSLRKDMDAATPIPFLVDGNTDAVTDEIELFARTLCPKVARGGDAERVKLHVAAVFACNFVNYMYLQSATYCEKEHIDFSLLQPLIEETANRLRHYHPAEVFTGPAVRGDVGTVQKHVSLLEAYPALQEVYTLISGRIMNK